MLPSRGLRPHQFAPLARKQSLLVRQPGGRQFSSIPRKSALSTLPCRTSPLRSTNWRAGAALTPNVKIDAASVRYGSWYAPWSWGKSSPPPDATPAASSSAADQFVPEAVHTPEPTVTTATPEMAPAGIDKAATVNSSDPKTVEELLGVDPTPPVDTTPIVDVGEPITYWGNLKDLGLDYGWGPTAFFENLMELSYLNLDAGWVGSIAASAVILRLILFFGFQVRGSDSMAKLASMKPILQPLMDQMEEAKRRGEDDKVQALKMKQQSIMSEVGGDMFKNLGTPIAGMVTGFGAFRCLRGMSELPVPGMTTESFLWINDLTVADPTYALPVLTAGLMYAVIKMGGETGMNTEATVTSMQKQMQFVLPIVMAVFTSFQPAAVQIYFFLSAFMAGGTAHLLKQPAVRRFLKIRTLPTKESNELFKKVVKGEVKLDAVKTPSGTIRYQAPSTRSPSSSQSRSAEPSSPSSKPHVSTNTSTSTRGIGTLKPGIRLPAHISPLSASFQTRAQTKTTQKELAHDLDRDDYDAGGVGSKWASVKRNFNLSRGWSWVKSQMDFDKRDKDVREREQRREKQREASRRYEEARKRRLEGN